MLATKLLKQQHREVEKLFAEYEKATSGTRKPAIFRELADSLAAHMKIEETLFYPRVFTEELEDRLEEAVEEHLAAKRVIEDLLSMKTGDQNFDAKVKVLSEQIEHHVGEEEAELFPQVEKKLAKKDLEGLGKEMFELFNEAMRQRPREQIPTETSEAAALR